MVICRKIMKSTTEIRPEQRMWRTLVRVTARFPDGVVLMIPGLREGNCECFCPRKAIPPVIFEDMKENERYHVGCNRGAEDIADLCFDGWEDK